MQREVADCLTAAAPAGSPPKHPVSDSAGLQSCVDAVPDRATDSHAAAFTAAQSSREASPALPARPAANDGSPPQCKDAVSAAVPRKVPAAAPRKSLAWDIQI